MEEQCKDGVRADGVSSLIVAAGERCSLLGVGFENMMRSWVKKWGAQQRLGVVASWWLGGGKAKAQGRGMGWNDWDKLEQRWSKTQKRQLKEVLQIGVEMVSDSKATTWGGVAGWKIKAQCKDGVRADGVAYIYITQHHATLQECVGVLPNSQPACVTLFATKLSECCVYS